MGKKKKTKETVAVREETPKLDIYIITILALTFLIPILVAPYLLENIFNLPKTLLMMMGAFLMLAIYGCRFVLEKSTPYPKTTTPAWLILIIILNFISFFYTQNYYYTKVAALMNICAIGIFYFTSLNTNNKNSIWIFTAIMISGFIVAFAAFLQFTDASILPLWLKTGKKTTGLIGNSNYLGAYLLFPLISMAGLIFLLQGVYRPIIAALSFFVFIAFLFARAKASWLGLFFSIPVLLLLIKNIYNFSILDYIKGHPKWVVSYVIISLCLLAVITFGMPSRFYTELKTRLNLTTLHQRLQFYDASWRLFKKSPIFGTGLWSYRNQVYRIQAEMLQENPNYFKGKRVNQPKRAHNEYLEALNDGGILAAAVLLMFFLTIMKHGLTVIRDNEAEKQTRIIASTAFSIMIAVMIDAVFFFPFRINTTLFLTALTLGVLEGTYLHQYLLIKESQPRRFPFAQVFVCIIILILLSVFWFRGIRPFKAEMEHFKFRQALYHKKFKQAETHILQAISYDPGLTRYHIYAAMMYANNFRNFYRASELIEPSLINFVGDNVLWGVYYTKGLIRFQMGSLFEAKELFQKSLYYNPQYIHSLKKLEELDRIFKEHDKICIKLK